MLKEHDRKLKESFEKQFGMAYTYENELKVCKEYMKKENEKYRCWGFC